jgi:hypothetical protein
MATIQVILRGYPSGGPIDAGDTPVVLQFDQDGEYENAWWFIPGFGQELPAYVLSEIRVDPGQMLTVSIEGPEGIQSGPHQTNWVRCDYPRGKLFSLLHMNAETRTTTGVSITVEDGKLQLDEVKLGG